MTMSDRECIIHKVDEDFELVTNAKNMRFHFKGNTHGNNTTIGIFRTLRHESYYNGREVIILPFIKSDVENNFAFVTDTMNEFRENIFNNGLTYHSEYLNVSITIDDDIGNLSEVKISTTLLVNNLPQRKSHPTIIKALKCLFEDENVTKITFKYNFKQKR